VSTRASSPPSEGAGTGRLASGPEGAPPAAGERATRPLPMRLAALLEPAAEPWSEGRAELPIEAGEAVWFVRGGEVEVFACQRGEAGEERNRTHLATATAGQLLSAGRPGASGENAGRPGAALDHPDVALLGVPHPGAQVLLLEAGRLRRLAAGGGGPLGSLDDPGARDDLAAGFDGWLAALLGEIAHLAAPKLFVELRPDEAPAPAAAGTAARSSQGVIWVRPLDGRCCFMGEESLALPPGSRLPLSPRAWLLAQEPARLECRTTAALLAQDELWPALGDFHRLLLAYAALRIERAAAQQRARLAARGERDRRTVEGACTRLLSVLESPGGFGADGGRDAEGSALYAGAGALLSACRLVGERQGIQIRSVPESLRRGRQSEGLAAICNASRVRFRRVILRGEWWRRDNGPLLAFQVVEDPAQARRPVALLPSSPRGYDLVDPASAREAAAARGGAGRPVDPALAQSLAGDAYMFYPPLPERALTRGDLARHALRRVRPEIASMVLMGLAGGLLGLLVPVATAQVFGSAIPGANRSQLLQITLALIAAAGATAVFQITRSIAVLRLGAKVEGSLQAAVWDHLLALPVTFFRRFTVGDLAERSLGIDKIRELFTGNAATSILAAVFSLFSFALLFYYSMPLALVATGLVALMAGVTWLLTFLQLRHQRELFRLQGKLASLVFGLINGIGKLRIAGAEQRAFARWAARFAEQRRRTIDAQRIANIQAAFGAVYGVLTWICIFAMVGFSSRTSLPLGDFLAFNAAFSQFLAAALAMIGVFSSILAMVPIYERLAPILETAPEVDPAKADAGELAGEIELDHISFRYQEDGPLVLDDVSFHAGPGEFIALVGPSGSGKSTCLRLILGFEKPAAGSIYFDGQDLSGLSVQSVRRQIGVVLQSGRPLVGDILGNILGGSNLSVEDAWEAARMAGLEEDIRNMPMGMYTMIGEGADTFSGGQKQRILIARAIVHRPRIILFDEATSALDNRTQEIVSRSLERLKATRIVIAHRLSTIAAADRIYAIEDGRVVEAGTYRELAGKGGLFARLIARQIA
jgi:NHLM bacteriocin system ABC transporter ATP-binding protein